MKKVYLIAAAALVALCGCGGSDPNATRSTKENTTKATVEKTTAEPTAEMPPVVAYNATSASITFADGTKYRDITYDYSEENAFTVRTYDYTDGVTSAEKFLFDENGYLASYATSEDGRAWDVVYNIAYNDVRDYWYGYAEYADGVAEDTYVYVSYPQQGQLQLAFYEQDTPVTTYIYQADASGWYFDYYAVDEVHGSNFSYYITYDNGGYIMSADVYDETKTLTYRVTYYYE